MTEKLKTLTMTPSDWSELDKRLSPGEYHRMVRDYQARERALLPKCNGAFGVCRYNDHGICGCKDGCCLKMYPPKD